MTRQRYVLDANVLVSIVSSDHPEHFSSYSFFRNHDDDGKVRWVVPGLIFFEFQATQSKLSRKRGSKDRVFRHSPLNYENTELYQVTKRFLLKVFDLGLYDKFGRLSGQDLLYACIAYAESIPLVTHDKDFDQYSKELTLISPREIYGTGNTPLAVGSITVQKNGKIYTTGYKVFRGIVQLDTGHGTHTDGPGAAMMARRLLIEIIDSGLADKKKLGRREN
jgi:predicted nucleic acid-binding protein